MPARQATTLAQRHEILRLAEKEGYTYAAAAAASNVRPLAHKHRRLSDNISESWIILDE